MANLNVQPNYFANNYAANNPNSQTASMLSGTSNASSGGGASVGTAVGGAVGMLAGPVGSIIGSVAGSAVGGIFDMIQGSKNRKAAEEAHREAMEMAERQFAWGQDVDRFNMNIEKENLALTKRQTNQAISRDRVNQLNEMLRTNVGLQDRVRQLWGGK